MKNTIQTTISENTKSFIEALISLDNLQNNLLNGFKSLYGEDDGERLYYEFEGTEYIRDLGGAIKRQIGESIEVSLVWKEGIKCDISKRI